MTKTKKRLLLTAAVITMTFILFLNPNKAEAATKYVTFTVNRNSWAGGNSIISTNMVVIGDRSGSGTWQNRSSYSVNVDYGSGKWVKTAGFVHYKIGGVVPHTRWFESWAYVGPNTVYHHIV